MGNAMPGPMFSQQGGLPGPKFNSNYQAGPQFNTNIFGQPMSNNSWNPSAPTNSQGVVSIGHKPPPPNQDMLSQLQALWNLGLIANGPKDQGINNDITSYQQQLGLANANQQSQTGYINTDAGLQQQKLDLQGSDLGIQQGANSRASALLPFTHQLSLDALGEQDRQAQFGADQSNRQLTSQGVTSGALQSVGARQGFSDIGQQLAFSKESTERSRVGENLSFKEQQAQLADQKSQLNNAAKGLGIDSQELKNRTASALQQLGLSTALSVNDITKAINDLNAGRYNPLQSLLGQIYQMSGVKPVAG